MRLFFVAAKRSHFQDLVSVVFLLFDNYLFVFVLKTGESSVMSIFELRNPTAIDPALGINAVSAALKENAKEDGGNRAQADAPAQDPPRRAEITSGNVTTYLQAISATSCGEIDALISDLHHLRERLMTEGGRIEQGIAEFATLNQSVMKLTEVISDSVAHIQAPGVAG